MVLNALGAEESVQSVPLNPCGSLPGNRQEQVAPILQMGRLWLTGEQLAQGLGAGEDAVVPPP